MKASAWIPFLLASLLFLAVVIVPGVAACIELLRSGVLDNATSPAVAAASSPSPSAILKLSLFTALRAAVVTISALILAWLPARWLSHHHQHHRSRVYLLLCMMPLCLPPALVFWSVWQAWSVDSWLFTLASRNNLIPQAMNITACAALIAWSWPIAALILASSMKSRSFGVDDLLMQDRAGTLTSLFIRARVHATALLISALVIFTLMFNNTIVFDLAQQRTLGYELRAMDADGSSASTVLWAGLPGVLLAITSVCVIAYLAARGQRLYGNQRSPRATSTAQLKKGHTVLAWLIALVCAIGPLALLLAQPPPGWLAGTRELIIGYGEALRNSAFTAVATGACAAVIAIGLATAFASSAKVARWLAALQAIAWLAVAALPAMVIAIAIEAAYNHAGPGWLSPVLLYRSPGIVIIGQLAQFSFVAVLLAWWMHTSEPPAMRDLRRLDGSVGLRSVWSQRRPAIIATVFITTLLTAVLALGEVVITTRIQPPAFEAIAAILLNNMHYQRSEMVVLIGLMHVALAILASLCVALYWVSQQRRALRQISRSMTCMLVTAAAIVLLTSCRQEDAQANAQPQPLEVSRSFGSAGRSLGQFSYPRAMDINTRRGELIIIDRSGWVQRFSVTGEPLSRWQLPAFEQGYPTGVTIHPDTGNIYVADTHEFCVSIFSHDGTLLEQHGKYGTGPGEFIFPTDVAFGPGERIYVSEFNTNDRIQVFDRDWQPLFTFGHYGRGDGELNRPQSICFSDDRSELYVADAVNNRIAVFAPDGTWLRNLGSTGTDAGEFRYPYGVTWLGNRQLLVTEFGNSRLQVIDTNGNPLRVLGVTGEGEGELIAPWCSVVSDDEVFVLDSKNSRVQVFPRDF
ncbi:MAG: hypothetical protein ACR2GY_13910 [Phycisphaerales bacterium]